MNPNDSEKFGFIRIDRIHLDSMFGLILINSDWLDSIEFIRIDFKWASDWKQTSD